MWCVRLNTYGLYRQIDQTNRTKLPMNGRKMNTTRAKKPCNRDRSTKSGKPYPHLMQYSICVINTEFLENFQFKRKTRILTHTHIYRHTHTHTDPCQSESKERSENWIKLILWKMHFIVNIRQWSVQLLLSYFFVLFEAFFCCCSFSGCGIACLLFVVAVVVQALVSFYSSLL